MEKWKKLILKIILFILLIYNGELSMNYSKIAFLLNENISKFIMIEVPMGIKSTYLSYDIRPFPKVNHTNVNLVDKYKNELKQNIEYLKMIFFWF